MIVNYTTEALRSLKRMPANHARLILAKITQYAEDPASLAPNVKRLKGNTSHLRLRVGDWRVLFTSDGTIMSIERIAHRSHVYD